MDGSEPPFANWCRWTERITAMLDPVAKWRLEKTSIVAMCRSSARFSRAEQALSGERSRDQRPVAAR